MLYEVITGQKETANKKIVFASDATWPPMEFVNESGDIVGFDMDLLAAVAKEAGVITSYSIHYTKLYENPLLTAMLDKKKSYNLVELSNYLSDYIDFHFRHEEEMFRITSYNVCYTKLLRIVTVLLISKSRRFESLSRSFLNFVNELGFMTESSGAIPKKYLYDKS